MPKIADFFLTNIGKTSINILVGNQERETSVNIENPQEEFLNEQSRISCSYG